MPAWAAKDWLRDTESQGQGVGGGGGVRGRMMGRGLGWCPGEAAEPPEMEREDRKGHGRDLLPELGTTLPGRQEMCLDFPVSSVSIMKGGSLSIQ